MTGFSVDWLALREAVDARSRSRTLAADLPQRPGPILDLGAGTGANLRWLAPQLGPGQRWTLIDDDESLLAEACRRIRDWAQQSGFELRAAADGLHIAAADFSCSVTLRALDLSESLDDLTIPAGSLLTASALLDLVSEAWLNRLVDRIGAGDAAVLWALSYDGTVCLDPASPDDATIIALVNRHQRSDKGFGAALGPDAWRMARDRLEHAGLEVSIASTNWNLSAPDADLLDALIAGWAEAATAMAPAQASRILRWSDARRRQAALGRLRISVGHRDLAARPQDLTGTPRFGAPA